jgi:hypothetical protein
MASRILRSMGVSSIGILIALAFSASGQPEQTGDADSAACELHIWPTDKFVVTENLGGKYLGAAGALIDEAMKLKSPEGVKEQLGSQLSPDEQARIIKEIDPANLFRLKGYKVVIEPADSQPIWTIDRVKSDDRISKNQSKCYVEMAIISQQYLHQPIGTRLRTFIRYDEYDAGGKARIKVLDTTATKASEFPAERDDGIAASTASVQAAFRQNLISFATEKLKR